MHRLPVLALIALFLLLSLPACQPVDREPLAQDPYPGATASATLPGSPYPGQTPGYPAVPTSIQPYPGQPTLTQVTAGVTPTSRTRTPPPFQSPTITRPPLGTPTLYLSPTPTPSPTATFTPTPTPTPNWCSPAGVAAPATPLALAPRPMDGQLNIVYLNQGNAWIWTEDEGARGLTSTGDIQSALLSDDGQWIALERRLGTAEVEIWVVDRAGNNLERLASVEDFRRMARPADTRDLYFQGVVPHNLTWVPGRHLLAFNSRPVFADERDFAADDLWFARTGSLQPWNHLPHGLGGEFVFSPNGKEIALLTPQALTLINADGSNRRPDVIPDYHAVSLGSEQFYPRPVWAPDSSLLRVAVPVPASAQFPNPPVVVWELGGPGFDAHKVEILPQAFPPSVTFSPNLAWNSYFRWPDQKEDYRELYAIPLFGDRLGEGYYTVGYNLEIEAWAPDSLRFLYWNPLYERLHLGRLCAPPVRLTGLPATLGPTRWVDNDRFLFFGGSEKDWSLHLATLSGFEGAFTDELLIDHLDTAQYDLLLLAE